MYVKSVSSFISSMKFYELYYYLHFKKKEMETEKPAQIYLAYTGSQDSNPERIALNLTLNITSPCLRIGIQSPEDQPRCLLLP